MPRCGEWDTQLESESSQEGQCLGIQQHTEAAEALPSLSTGVLIGLNSERKGAAVVQLSVGVLAVSGEVA